MAKKLMKGCEALAEAAIQAGALHFFGYPITPQSEIPEYLSRRLPQVGGKYVQAESEVAASNMIYGAAGTGLRVWTSSSSPGISLMAEALSYIAAAELPCVLVNIVRGGPGLGGILPSQGDYFQATKGGGHGDYRLLVLAPSSIQEAVDLMMLAFDLAEKYRNPVMVMGDGLIGQMMEPVEFNQPPKQKLPKKDWQVDGTKGQREPNIINSLFLKAADLERLNRRMHAKYVQMEQDELRWEEWEIKKDLDCLIVAYGTVARIAKTTIELLAKDGIKVGLFRPISLFPYPYDALAKAAKNTDCVLCTELSMGQMLEDVKLALKGTQEPHFFGRQGGLVMAPEELADEVKKLVGKKTKKGGRK